MRNSLNNFQQIITSINSTNSKPKLAFAIMLVKLILHTALSKSNIVPSGELDKDERTFFDFVQLVDKYKLEKLPINKYCQLLNVSKTYLETIVHKHLGDCTPSKYIQLCLTYHICMMARNTSKGVLSTKEIAKRCHFSSTSVLTRFIKKEINMSLTTFKNLAPDKQLDIIHHTIPDQILISKAFPRTDKQECQAPPPS